MKRWPKRSFFPKKTMNAYQILRFFYENGILETSNDLDGSEISLFIEENRNVLKYNRKDKTDLKEGLLRNSR